MNCLIRIVNPDVNEKEKENILEEINRIAYEISCGGE